MITDGIKEEELNFTQLIYLYLKHQYEIGYAL